MSGESVTGLEWAPDATTVVFLTRSDASGEVVLREVEIAGMTYRELARRPNALALAGLAYSSDGPAWVEIPASIWVRAEDGPKQEVTLASPLYGLRAVPNGYLARDPDGAPNDILAVSGMGELSTRIHSSEDIGAFDVSRDGVTLVYEESEGPGTPLQFVLAQKDVELRKRPDGRLVGNPILQPGRSDVVLYENHDDGTLKSLNMRTGEVTTVLGEDVSEPRLAPDGRIAHTFVDPRRTNMLCVAQPARGRT